MSLDQNHKHLRGQRIAEFLPTKSGIKMDFLKNRRNQLALGVGLLVTIALVAIMCLLMLGNSACDLSDAKQMSTLATVGSNDNLALVTFAGYLEYGPETTSNYLPLKLEEVSIGNNSNPLVLHTDFAKISLTIIKADYTLCNEILIEMRCPNSSGDYLCHINEIYMMSYAGTHYKFVGDTSIRCRLPHSKKTEQQPVFLRIQQLEFEVDRPAGSPRDVYVTPGKHL